MSTIVGLFPMRVGFTIRPDYGYVTREDRESRNKANKAAHEKGLRPHYWEYGNVGNATGTPRFTEKQAKALAAKQAARFAKATGFKWTVTECMF